MKIFLLALLIFSLSACNRTPDVEGIEITDELMLSIHDTHTFEFILEPNDASAEALTWRSLDESIVHVESGTIETVGLGETEIEIHQNNRFIAAVKIFVVAESTIVEMRGHWPRWIQLKGDRLPSEYHEPEKNNHRFLGWFKDANYTQPFNPESIIASDTRLYAKFVNLEKTMNFDNTFSKDFIPEEEMQLIKIEADPEKGFQFPYYIAIPSLTHEEANLGYPRHLILEGYYYQFKENNLDYQQMNFENRMLDSYGHHVGEALFTPRIIPFIPQICMVDTSNFAYGKDALSGMDQTDVFMAYPKQDEMQYLFPQGLGYYITHIENTIDDLVVCEPSDGDLIFNHELEDYIVKFENIHQQIHHMIEDAQYRLNDAGWNLEEQIFINSIESGAAFAQRYASIYPNQVKAFFAGATQYPLLPGSSHNDYDLNYPLGTNDYEALFGQAFDLESFNQIAKIYHTGANNLGDDILYLNGFNLSHREALYNALGQRRFNDQWPYLIDAYYELGGEGLFITDTLGFNTVHTDMIDYVIDFFKINRAEGGPYYDMTYQHSRFRFELNNDD